METILIVDDDERVITSIIESLSDGNYSFKSDVTGKHAIGSLTEGSVNLVLLDVFLGEVNGIDLLKKIRAQHPAINVVMISGESDIETAITAIRSGAFDFLEKPIRKAKLQLTVKNALSDSKFKIDNSRLRDRLLDQYAFTGTSSAILDIEKIIEKTASSTIPVLIAGENGTGKEIAARRLHYLSDRASMPFTALNCASIPRDLLESELFGHRKGSFTGAISEKEGLFISSNGGTIFLDEIGDMPFELQSKLLRVLQEKEVTQIGGTKPVKVDVRIISATNKDLESLMKNGGFRDDLFYRLNGIQITIPPLRKRKSDIPDLVRKFVTEYCYENNLSIIRVKDSALDELMRYDFPGNIRELKNIIYRTILMFDGEAITSFHLPLSVHDNQTSNIIPDGGLGIFAEVKRHLIRAYLEKRLSELHNDKKALAQELGIHLNNLYRLLKDYN